MPRLTPLLSLAVAIALALVAPPAALSSTSEPAQPSLQQVRRDLKKYNVDKEALALGGYDPVAYFKEGGGKPARGSKEIVHVHEGVTYRFATEKNREAFKKDPARYEPAYGGWCAYAMASDSRVEIDPKSFLVTDGRLYLFYKGLFNDTRAKWNKKPDDLRVKADAAWKKFLADRKK